MFPVQRENEEGGAEHEQLLERVLKVFESRLNEEDFTVDQLAEAMCMSRSQVFRKVNQAAGVPPNELLRIYRYRRAAFLLKAKEMNITQVMYEIGLRNPSYFAETFRKYFGINPSRYREKHSRSPGDPLKALHME